MHEQSRAFASRLLQMEIDDHQRLIVAFEMTQAKIPSDDEMSDAFAFLESYSQDLGADEKARIQAWAALARVLFSSNAFLYVD